VAANELAIYNPQGRLLRTIPIPEKPSNLCFGPDEKTIFVTARATVYKVLPDAKPAQAQQ
jgi:gluconolactonase